MKFKLRKPVEFDGNTVMEINLDLESLTGEDILQVERQFSYGNSENQANMIKEFSKEWQILVAAKAAKLPKEFFLRIDARDFSLITIAVQNFFVLGSAEG